MNELEKELKNVINSTWDNLNEAKKNLDFENFYRISGIIYGLEQAWVICIKHHVIGKDT